jgi:hypothetical protein
MRHQIFIAEVGSMRAVELCGAVLLVTDRV